MIQIAGRAGRYGHHEKGYIGATRAGVLEHIDRMFHSPLPTIKPPFQVKATTFQILELAKHLKTDDLDKILRYYSKHMRFTGPFVAAKISSMIELSQMIKSKKGLTLEEKYLLAQAPVTTKSPLIKSAYNFYVNAIIKKEVVHYRSSILTVGIAKTEMELLKAEDEIKKITLYLWMAFKFPDLFPDSKEAELARIRANRFCEASLKSGKLLKPTVKRHHAERRGEKPTEKKAPRNRPRTRNRRKKR